MAFPVATIVGLMASFLAYGAEPLSLMLLFLLFDASREEASASALTIAVCSLSGKLLIMLIRMRFALPHADTLLWLMPGAALGALLSIPGYSSRLLRRSGDALLKLSMFTSLLNVAAAMMR